MFTCEDVVNSFNQNANDGFSLWCNAVLKVSCQYFPTFYPTVGIFNILNTSCNEREFETFRLNKAGALLQKSELASWTVIIGLLMRATPN